MASYFPGAQMLNMLQNPIPHVRSLGANIHRRAMRGRYHEFLVPNNTTHIRGQIDSIEDFFESTIGAIIRMKGDTILIRIPMATADAAQAEHFKRLIAYRLGEGWPQTVPEIDAELRDMFVEFMETRFGQGSIFAGVFDEQSVRHFDADRFAFSQITLTLSSRVIANLERMEKMLPLALVSPTYIMDVLLCHSIGHRPAYAHLYKSNDRNHFPPGLRITNLASRRHTIYQQKLEVMAEVLQAVKELSPFATSLQDLRSGPLAKMAQIFEDYNAEILAEAQLLHDMDERIVNLDRNRRIQQEREAQWQAQRQADEAHEAEQAELQQLRRGPRVINRPRARTPHSLF